MFDPAALLRHASLLIALLQRLINGVSWVKKNGPPPAPLRACLEKTEQALAQAIRAGLSERGEAIPDSADHELIAWFVRTHGDSRCSKNTPTLWTAGAPAGVLVEQTRASHLLLAGAPAVQRARPPP